MTIPMMLILIMIAATAGVALLTWSMRRLRLRAQFMVLVVLGVSIGFIFFMMVQLPTFPHWLGISLVAVVFVASLFGTRAFLRSLAQEEREEADGIPVPRPISPDTGFSNVNPPRRTR
jgi:hypothetical protein